MANSELRRRRQAIESSRSAGDGVDPAISASWERCRPSIDERRAAAPVDAEADEVADRWAASPIRRSGIGVEDELGRAADASGLIAAVTDADGRILWTAGSREMRAIAEPVGFVPGGRWDEPSAGTNALGLALLTGRPATVFSAEHWCSAVHDWVCWSVPITDGQGRRLGVLDLSGKWDRASPVAELAVSALGRLVEANLPTDTAPADGAPLLDLRLLGRPSVTLGGRPLTLTPRQFELLAALAIEGPASLDQLHTLVHGDRPVGTATTKAELSHLRRLLGGGIASRPYRLTMPVRVDAVALRHAVNGGDVAGAVELYAGQLLPDSESPFAVDQRHITDVVLRRTLLEHGDAAQLLRYADVHRFDEAVLEGVLRVAAPDDPLRHEASARLDLARQ